MAIITIITIQVAKAIETSHLEGLERFYKEADRNAYTTLTHRNYFYSYPEWGKEWWSGKSCEFHSVETKCHLCEWKPKRNYAGIGTIYLLHNGASESCRMILLCPLHVGGYYEWRPNKEKIKHSQLELFEYE